MGKGKLKLTGAGQTDPIVDEIVNDVKFDRADAIVIIGIPSHDQKKQVLPKGKQAGWANAAMEKFADLFGGATALRSHKGIYKSGAGDYLWDDTILIQGFTDPSVLEDKDTVGDVVAFARRMRKDLSQEAVFIVFNNIVRFIKAEK